MKFARYTNKQTWSVDLIIKAEGPLYCSKLALLKAITATGHTVTAEHVQTFITYQMHVVNRSIDCEDLARRWEIGRLELLANVKGDDDPFIPPGSLLYDAINS